MMKKILIGCALAAGVAIAAHAVAHAVPVEHFTARAVEATSPARITFRPVDIVISRWSTFTDHQLLMQTLVEKGPVSFINVLCGFASSGTISVVGAPDIAIRYAWTVDDRGGSRRIYIATDEPISLTAPMFRRLPEVEPLTFLELRVNRNGEGEGKLSEAMRLSVDESRGVIELRDYANRPLHLVMVRSEAPFEE